MPDGPSIIGSCQRGQAVISEGDRDANLVLFDQNIGVKAVYINR